MGPKEIAEALGKKVGSVKKLLWTMARDHHIHLAGRGKYTCGPATSSAVTHEVNY